MRRIRIVAIVPEHCDSEAGELKRWLEGYKRQPPHERFCDARRDDEHKVGRGDDLRRNQMEPAPRNGDWSGAAVAAADGLDSPPG